MFASFKMRKSPRPLGSIYTRGCVPITPYDMLQSVNAEIRVGQPLLTVAPKPSKKLQLVEVIGGLHERHTGLSVIVSSVAHSLIRLSC